MGKHHYLDHSEEVLFTNNLILKTVEDQQTIVADMVVVAVKVATVAVKVATVAVKVATVVVMVADKGG